MGCVRTDVQCPTVACIMFDKADLGILCGCLMYKVSASQALLLVLKLD